MIAVGYSSVTMMTGRSGIASVMTSASHAAFFSIVSYMLSMITSPGVLGDPSKIFAASSHVLTCRALCPPSKRTLMMTGSDFSSLPTTRTFAISISLFPCDFGDVRPSLGHKRCVSRRCHTYTDGTTIDIANLCGNVARLIGQEISRFIGDRLQRCSTSERRLSIGKFTNSAKVFDSARRERVFRRCRYRIDANIELAEVGCEVQYRSVQRGFGDAHYVVMRIRASRRVEGQGQHAAVVGHHRSHATGNLRERIAGDAHRLLEVGERRVAVAALKLLRVREGNAVDKAVERRVPLEDAEAVVDAGIRYVVVAVAVHIDITR